MENATSLHPTFQRLLLENKLDYLKLDFTTKREVRDCYGIILNETWLKPSVPDDAVSIEGLTTF